MKNLKLLLAIPLVKSSAINISLIALGSFAGSAVAEPTTNRSAEVPLRGEERRENREERRENFPLSSSLFPLSERIEKREERILLFPLSSFLFPLSSVEPAIAPALRSNIAPALRSNIETNLFVQGTPAVLTVEAVEARSPADGRSLVTIRGQIKDDRGNLSQQNIPVTLSASAGEFIGEDADPDRAGFQVQATAGEFTAQLRSPLDAQTVKIHATTPETPFLGETGFLGETRFLEAFTQIEFTTYLRPTLISGVVDFRWGKRGLDYWDSLRDFLPADQNHEYQASLTGAMFATGKVRLLNSDWLFTGAYNSARPLNQNCHCDSTGLFGGLQFNDLQYPTYGDTSTTQRTTPSQDSVFLRFERSSPVVGAGLDYLMWGDYATSEFASPSQEFSAINRSLHGLTANYNIGNLQLTGIYADNLPGFQRDTLPPDGTSGYYFLSRRLIIDGSEAVFIEAEDEYRPGTVLQRQPMLRGDDYEIDYDRGSILFRRPVQQTGIRTVNGVSIPVVYRIVATYQYEDQGASTNLYGGRLRYHLSRGEETEGTEGTEEIGSKGGFLGWLGASYVRQDQGVRDFELYGADMFLSFGGKAPAAIVTATESLEERRENREERRENFPLSSFLGGFQGQLSAEFAHSTNNSEILGLVTGEAYRVDFTGSFGLLAGRTYFRTADRGFANDTTVSFVPGQTRYGVEANANLTATTSLRFAYDFERNWGTAGRSLSEIGDLLNPGIAALPGTRMDNSLRTVTAGLQQRFGRITTGLDWIYRDRRDDQATSPFAVTSSQLRSRIAVPITDTISLRAQNELNLSSERDTIYPNRTILGADWQIAPGLTLGLNHQFFSGGQYKTNAITNLSLNGDYSLTENTTITGRYSMVDTQAMSAAVGIQHGWDIRPGLRLDLAYEHIFGSIFGRTSTGDRFAQPYAPGQSAANLGTGSGDSYSIGLSYAPSSEFQAAARYEQRFSAMGNNMTISAAVNGKPTEWLTVMGRYQQAAAANQLLADLDDTINLRLGLAYRHPRNDRFNALLRYEYRQNPAIVPESILFDTGTSASDHTFAAELIYTPSWRWEFYGKHALRKSTSYLADDLVGSSLVSLSQLRATYRFAYRWDIGAEGRWIRQPEADYDEFGAAAELGFYLTPDLRASVGYGFGEVRDRDFDSDRSAGGFYFGLTVKMNQVWSGF